MDSLSIPLVVCLVSVRSSLLPSCLARNSLFLDASIKLIIMNFNDLGDKLRDGAFRSCFTSSIISFLNEANPNLKQNQQVLDILRCTINITADNDQNRDLLTSTQPEVVEFWSNIKNLTPNDSIDQRVFILLGQFLHNTEFKSKYLEFLYSIKIHDSLIVSRDLEDFLLEYIPLLNEEESTLFAQKVIYYLENADEDEDIDIIVSTIPLALSFQETNIGLQGLNLRILNLLNKFPSLTAQRHLFAASGNISSMNGYNDWEDMKNSVANIIDLVDNPYVVAASSINVGNYITNQDTLAQVMTIIPLPTIFVNNYFAMKLGDVIQIQSVHMLRNLINHPDFVAPIWKNHLELLKFAKVIVDNGSYYPEILLIFNRFIVKLIGNSKGDILQYSLWENLEDEEVGYLLLQKYLELPIGEPELLKRLLTNAVRKPSGAIQLPVLLSKLKTLGMLFHALSKAELTLANIFIDNQVKLLEEYKVFIDELVSSFGQSEEVPPPILVNNSKFVAATTISSFEFLGLGGDEVELILSICKGVIA